MNLMPFFLHQLRAIFTSLLPVLTTLAPGNLIKAHPPALYISQMYSQILEAGIGMEYCVSQTLLSSEKRAVKAKRSLSCNI
jgi:hypothetical protein